LSKQSPYIFIERFRIRMVFQAIDCDWSSLQHEVRMMFSDAPWNIKEQTKNQDNALLKYPVVFSLLFLAHPNAHFVSLMFQQYVQVH
jgi:hypothetical protein